MKADMKATMAPSAARKPRLNSVLVTLAIWLAIALGMALLALANPINRDEGNFIAPAAVSAGLKPFLDYLYLQTPLQAQISGAFARLFPDYAFIALRLINALMGTGILALVYAAQRSLAVERRTAALCTALLACCYSFQFGVGVVRNDALPALLATAGIYLALLGLQGRLRPVLAWGLTGVLLGLAISAKLSYALPAAGFGVFQLWQLARRRIAPEALISAIAGGLVGLLPCLIAWRDAPDAFDYGVLTFYTSGAVGAWFKATGQGWIANPAANLLIATGILLVGPALGTLLLVARRMIRNPWPPDNACIMLLDILIVAGIVAALLPTPTNFQYVLTLLPPLFIRAGASGLPIKLPEIRSERGFAILAAIGAVVGGIYGLIVVGTSTIKTGTLPAIHTTRQAHWVGAQLRAAGAEGFISTLSPHLVLDSGYPSDPRFASGVFVFRIAAGLTAERLDQLHVIGPPNLTAALDQNPPAAVVIGQTAGVDMPLRDYAVFHGYRAVVSPDATFFLLIRPIAKYASALDRTSAIKPVTAAP